MAIIVNETTDASSTTGTAYALAAGDVFFGTNAQGASDWVAVTLRAGVTYTFGAVGLGAARSGLTDPLIKLYSPTGVLIDADDDGGPGVTASQTFTPGSSATYFIEVKALTSSGAGRYGLAVTEGALPSYGTPMAAAVLYRDGDSWAATPQTPVTVSWGVRASGPAEDANGAITGFQGLSAAQIAATKAALANYSDVAGISFAQVSPGGVTNAATILVGAYRSATDGAGAYANFPGSTAASSVAGDLWINNASVSQTQVRIGTYDYWVFLHELGHAMGLSHPGDYNAEAGVNITYAGSAQIRQDSNQYTVMSYFDATATESQAPGSYADTLLLHDIYAVQQLYGVNHGTRAGNDTYGFHSNLGGAYDFTSNADPLLCIWDGAGRDRLDLSGFAARQRIDLRAGVLSDVGGFRGNLSIALGCQIEEAVGGTGNDRMRGNGSGNLLNGAWGADVLDGGAGQDRLVGGAGADVFVFGRGDGQDRVMDFGRGPDVIRLEAGLWGGGALTGAQVLNRFASVHAGNLVLDFGTDVLTLMHVTSLTGIADHLVIA